MGTKNKPGDYDCYVNAEPDEPMFILLGRDPMAAFLVRAWADYRELQNEDPRKVKEARDCADQMQRWAEARGKGERAAAFSNYWEKLKELVQAAREFARTT